MGCFILVTLYSKWQLQFKEGIRHVKRTILVNVAEYSCFSYQLPVKASTHHYVAISRIENMNYSFISY
jgi:hypothetical protein